MYAPYVPIKWRNLDVIPKNVGKKLTKSKMISPHPLLGNVKKNCPPTPFGSCQKFVTPPLHVQRISLTPSVISRPQPINNEASLNAPKMIKIDDI